MGKEMKVQRHCSKIMAISEWNDAFKWLNKDMME